MEGSVYVSKNELKIPTFGTKDIAIYINQKLEETLLTSLLFLDGGRFQDYELVYRNAEIKVYKVNYGDNRQ